MVRQSVRMLGCCEPLRRDTCSEIPESHSTAMVRRSERTMNRCVLLRRSEARTLARRYRNRTHQLRRSGRMSGCCVPLKRGSRLGLSRRRSGRIRTNIAGTDIGLLCQCNEAWLRLLLGDTGIALDCDCATVGTDIRGQVGSGRTRLR